MGPTMHIEWCLICGAINLIQLEGNPEPSETRICTLNGTGNAARCPMPDDDRVASTLAEIRERFSAASKLGYGGAILSAADVPLLLAAIEAVLKRHHRSGRPVKTHNLCRDHSALAHYSGRMPREVIEICPECTVTEKWVCATCRHECPDDDEWPCAEYRAITAALTGEEAADAG